MFGRQKGIKALEKRIEALESRVGILASRTTLSEYVSMALIDSLARKGGITSDHMKAALTHRIVSMRKEKDSCVPEGHEQSYRDTLSFMAQTLVSEFERDLSPKSN